jgi:hypothetical protein
MATMQMTAKRMNKAVTMVALVVGFSGLLQVAPLTPAALARKVREVLDGGAKP